MAARAFDYTTWPQSTLLLNASLTARGTELQGDDSRLSCARASLAAGLRLTTAAIGGSIIGGSSERVSYVIEPRVSGCTRAPRYFNPYPVCLGGGISGHVIFFS